ncbi:acetyl-CoA synthetase-like protein [Patellaria atrata CBS 101060]|uniref:Very long-chain fatty acid transport protein n=1 Tax=Patellaria atrata CBS 101060 TaxID=1346257 RepID=A0A9P4SBS5_9PEZI|nr:acetyl-CoA synthetase-like protein [Patellaria atrata CBS 101060]
MALATSAAAIAATGAAAAYLDAKLQIAKDVKTLYWDWSAARQYAKHAKNKRVCIWYRFEEQALKYRDSHLCIWSRDGCYNWSDAYAQSCRYGQFLISRGVKSGELMAFYLTNSPNFMFATLGSWAVGSAPALINYNLGGDGLVHCLKISGAKVILVDDDEACLKRIEEVRGRIEGELGMRIVVLDKAAKSEINALEPKRPEDKYRENIPPEFPMCLLYTSGSTGFPKACAFQMIRTSVLGTPRMKSLGLKAGPSGDRWYICMPLYHGTGNTTAVCCMISGITLCVGKKFSVSRFWDDIRDSDATAFVYVGETARYLLAAPLTPKDRQHRVKMMFGNGLRPDVWEKFSERFGVEYICEFFNSTEGMPSLLNASRGPYRKDAVGYHGALMRLMLRNKIVPVEVDGETGDIWRDPKTGFARRKPYEEGGEILVKLPHEKVFVGYWENEKATQSKFERDVFAHGDLWYRSGDALRRTPDGRWFFLDRLGDTYRWKSENVSTLEIASLLSAYPAILEAIVYGVLVPGFDGRAGCAAIFIRASHAPASMATFLAQLMAYCRKAMPKYAIPIFLRLLKEIVPMHNNKQNKVPLKKEGIDVRAVEESSTGDTMYWAPALLGREVVGVEPVWVEFKQGDLDALREKAQYGVPPKTVSL